ncbi:MAG TPA: heme-binding protein [bacterium]|nr:heme-binding protein [bacterium]
MAGTSFGYEQAFEKTPVGEIVVRTVPAATVLLTNRQGDYFKESNRLFMSLFRYIDGNKIAMTVPVIGELSSCGMSFFVLGKDLERYLPDNPEVRVVRIPEREVVSYGCRGAYTEKNVTKARARLEQYMLDHPDYLPAGDTYAVFWNGPFTLGFLKRFEVHIPVKKRE